MLWAVDYAEAQAAFFQTRPGASVDLADRASPGRRLRDAIEPIATIVFWSEPAYREYSALGLDFLGGYVLARSAPLGHPDPAVVAAAFAAFEPGAIAGLYRQATETTTVDAVLQARSRAAGTALQEVLGSPPDAPAVAAALRRAAQAGSPAGRPLFAGAAALEWPQDPLGQVWHAAAMLREYRGDGHVAACVAQGIDGIEANILTELRVGYEPLDYTASRAWSPEAMSDALDRLGRMGLVRDGRLTEAGSELRERVEAATEASVAPALAALGGDLEAVVAAIEGWSQAIIEAGWFPPDPYKRAAG